MNKVGFCKFALALALALSFSAFGCGGDSEKGATSVGAQAVTTTEPRPSTVEALITALGGQRTLDSIQRLRIQGSGTRHIVNEGVRPGDDPDEANTFQRSVSIDLGADALRVDTSRDIVFQFRTSQEYSDTIRGKLGVSTQTVFGIPVGALSSDKVAAIRRQELLLTPHLLLRELTPAALADGKDETLDGALQHTLVALGGPAPLTLFVDASSGLITKLQTMEHAFYERDVRLEVLFDDWAPVGDTNFPRSTRVLVNGRERFNQQVSDVTINPAFDAGTFEFPASLTPVFDEALYARGVLSHQWYAMFDSIGLPVSGLDLSIKPVDVARNVRQLVGPTHHTFVVQQQSGLILVDAPQYDERGGALVDYLAAAYPGVPVTHVVASHFHEDHVAGIREVLGRTKASLVVQESVAEFWRGLLAAPSTLSPDALADSPRSVNVLTVPDGGELTLDDASNPVTLYHLSTPHAADMLLTRDVASNSVFVVDIYSPGLAVQSGAAELDGAIRSYDIPTAELRIVGAHGAGIDDYATLQASLTPR